MHDDSFVNDFMRSRTLHEKKGKESYAEPLFSRLSLQNFRYSMTIEHSLIVDSVHACHPLEDHHRTHIS